MVCQGPARLGLAWCGLARPSTAGFGTAGFGKVRAFGPARSGLVWSASVRWGVLRFGKCGVDSCDRRRFHIWRSECFGIIVPLLTARLGMVFLGVAGLGRVGFGIFFSGGKSMSSQDRQFLPTLADLVDRMTIVLQKQIFIPENREEYLKEMQAIMHDIDLILGGIPRPIGAKEIRAIIVIQLANAYIWQNETRIRDGSSNEPADVQLRRLKATHAVNGVRATGKNALSAFDQGRMDYKIDALAADLPPEFGNWKVFE